ncbi:hypothetical protein CYJ28_00105 [Aerococcus sanguinicola]|uniref:Uncharacterized protein n=1 Tax=Aerococcus sanguinicola TaxID=119206 RepID=A0A109RD39_9LACT|nr:hypothetical protein AWM72_00740 [Aerococcus sanguinicola]OFT92269.1 hypothetical protein HMPREF3090_09100 [Aerococcus sp. HMSC23C02]PKZ22995.1 hypothetical protein CYJ28_00105 [Aerococcus sanguinicola]
MTARLLAPLRIVANRGRLKDAVEEEAERWQRQASLFFYHVAGETLPNNLPCDWHTDTNRLENRE